MSGIGPKRKGNAPRGRPRKKPGYDKEKNINELLSQAVNLFGVPFDDRDERPSDAPTISAVADEMKTSRMRVRKLLITADFYSSEMSRRVQELQRKGYSISKISEQTGLGRAAVHSYLPYPCFNSGSKGIYNLIIAIEATKEKWRY